MPLLFRTVVGFFCVSIAYSAVPKALIFNEKPIDALCWAQDKTTINLQHCGIIEKKYQLKGQNQQLIKQGYIGFEWQEVGSTASGGYSYYRFFSAGQQHYWIFTVNSGGGSGEMTELYSVQRINQYTIKKTALAGGDRCNGGLNKVSGKNHQLTYSVHLTAYDLLQLSSKTHTQLKAYEDIAACAVCCIGKAIYQVQHASHPQFLYLDLGTDSDIQKMPQQGSKQACFNQIISTYITQEKTRLNQDELNRLVKQVHQRCL